MTVKLSLTYKQKRIIAQILDNALTMEAITPDEVIPPLFHLLSTGDIDGEYTFDKKISNVIRTSIQGDITAHIENNIAIPQELLSLYQNLAKKPKA